MEFLATVQRVNSLVESASRRFGSIAPLATRLVIGLAVFQAGLGKWRHKPNIIQFFDSLGIPLPAFNAYLVASIELVGGIALILGLFTRFFAAGLTTTMVVALLTADTADFMASWGSASEMSPTDVTAFTFLLFLLWLVAYGAGKLSLDALLRRVFSLEPESLTGGSPTAAESV